MNKPTDETLEAALVRPAASRTLYAQKATELARDLDRLIDRMQAFGAEVDDEREVAVLHVAEMLTDAQHKLRRTILLLGMT